MSPFDAIEELIEMLGLNWDEAARVYLFENEEEQSDDQRAV